MLSVFATLTRNEQVLGYHDRITEFLSHRAVLATLTVLPALILFSFITVLPIVWAIAAGFYDIPVFSTDWEWVWLDNYVELVQTPELYGAIWRSTIYAVGSVVMQIVLGVGLALMLNKSFRFAKAARALAMLPYLIPTAVVGFIALWMGNGTWGVLNRIPQQLGLIDGPIYYFGDLQIVMIAVIATGTWKWASFVTIFVLARLQSIPDDLYEAAKVSGASRYQLFRDITLPNLKGVLFIIIFLRGIWMFNKFDIIWVLTQGGPGDVTETAPIFTFKTAFDAGELGMAAAISVLMFLLLLVVGILYFVILKPEEGVRVE